MKKRISALLLSAALCVGLLSNAAFAASDAPTYIENEDGSVTVSGDNVGNLGSVVDENGNPSHIFWIDDDGKISAEDWEVIKDKLDNGGQMGSNGQYFEKHEHSYTWVTTKQPTATEAGSKTGTCSCGATVTESIPATGTKPPVGPTGPTNPPSPNVPVYDPSKDADKFPFTDVKESDAWYDAVKYCYDHDLIRGVTSTTFNPKGTITREQIVIILWRQAGAPEQTATGLFTDMPGSSDGYNAVIWAANLGIAKGYGDGTFRPRDPINRQELATFLYRYETLYLGKAATGSAASLKGYSDHTYVGTWAEAEMRWAVGNGVLPEVSTSLAPTNDAPRYQAAMAMYRYCKDMLGID